MHACALKSSYLLNRTSRFFLAFYSIDIVIKNDLSAEMDGRDCLISHVINQSSNQRIIYERINGDNLISLENKIVLLCLTQVICFFFISFSRGGGSGQFFMFSFNLIFIHFLKPFFSIYDLFSFIPSFIHSFLVYIFLIYDQYLNKKHVKTFTFTFTFNEATGYLEMPTRLRESVQRKRSEL